MMAPTWMNAVIADFGHAAGAGGLSLNANGAAALKFANGISLRFEYTGEELVVAVTFRIMHDAMTIRRLLAVANPRIASGVRFRAGIIPKTGAAVVATRIPERDVTLPTVNATFSALWRMAEEIGGLK